MLVRELLQRDPNKLITTSPESSFAEAMDLLVKYDIGCLPVVDDQGHLTGIVSERDIFRKVQKTSGHYKALKVKDVMTAEVIVGVPEDTLEYIAGMMHKNMLRHIPIVDGDKMVGLISQRDMIKIQVKDKEIETRYLNLYLEGMSKRDMSGDN